MKSTPQRIFDSTDNLKDLKRVIGERARPAHLRITDLRDGEPDLCQQRPQHLGFTSRLGDRLQRLGLARPSVTGKDTVERATAGTETPRDHASDHGVDVSDEWAWVELNYRPHAYQACALTT